ncbi:DUF2975 domain-containing protein [Legionella oakridgensis]|uniref:DUF2975 domain-containing protein n=2 Tax=Legionella oakridgensis TaxID=29423 RepID=W0BD72_9GAMM|nr:DUF2975 domain-containing protein [Legionella oakridgensis]AHE66646.1 hypothetical protein Loa_01090 [Legionella oakridgensis ATCC 33761 = DSM 21215]KTD37761.1 hypothetical protein Loak_1437 [Legionella oakridgensis]STY19787.1 Protein of uncharacterised function (DUF2975) [Legionella longbeachae]
MQKIKSTSHLLFLFFRTLCWGIPLLMTYFILFNLQGMVNLGIWMHLALPDPIQNLEHFSLMHRLLILAIEAMPVSITVLICHQLANLFHLYEQGYLFEEKNIRLIKNISIYMIIGELIQLIYQPLITLSLTFNNPVGERLVSISLGSTNLSTLITAFIILVASWIIKEAQQLQSDSQLTI